MYTNEGGSALNSQYFIFMSTTDPPCKLAEQRRALLQQRGTSVSSSNVRRVAQHSPGLHDCSEACWFLSSAVPSAQHSA
eukprot:4454899-Amphidinium_carterae.1